MHHLQPSSTTQNLQKKHALDSLGSPTESREIEYSVLFHLRQDCIGLCLNHAIVAGLVMRVDRLSK